MPRHKVSRDGKIQGFMATILVIEDHPLLMTALREALEEVGHQVLTAPTGIAGVELYDEHPVDLVITEIAMTEREGLEPIEHLRGHPHRPSIIAMSGGSHHGSFDVLRAAKVSGADATLLKPFGWQELLGTVNKLLKGEWEA
jgi:DNA-binding response OmpR family regulator